MSLCLWKRGMDLCLKIIYWSGALAVCHGVRSIGHVSPLVELWNHVMMQCKWKTWLHSPQISGQSSPGLLQVGQQPSYSEWQIPQTSSPSFTSQDHWAAIVQDTTLIFILFCNNSCSKRLLIIVWLLDHFWYKNKLSRNCGLMAL